MVDAGGIASLVVAVGGGSVLNELLRNFLGRKKLGADASKIISEAAASTVTLVRSEAENLSKQVEKLTRQVENLTKLREQDDEDRRHHRIMLDAHAAWDRDVISRCESCTPVVELREMPPLYPLTTRFANPS